jgi:hypothetical protein
MFILYINNGKIYINTGEININTGKININTGEININTGEINISTGKININTGNIYISIRKLAFFFIKFTQVTEASLKSENCFVIKSGRGALQLSIKIC